ncbi:hypothetical protein B0H63DRAFT_190033 [Podospora didyma]|uniref:ARID domain-containing protein n=1 Tax=Podospora didyma TaxID=330526 RepID=A0AAE0NQT7_9PEZI|nr:hypothetical protein B0H63DRAFT_190033 [Podospora didyma]
MSSWINEAAVQNHNGNGFPHINDPSAVTGAMMDHSGYMGSPAQFNPQFANPQQMVMPNGPMRNASPSFPNPMYQTNQVIPSKRPRAREDSLGQSPRQAPGHLPTSRAETPQSQFSAFQQPGMPPQQQQQQQQPTGQPSPYPHLQPNGSANATPSPVISNQMRPGSVPQRVATTSPHPFSPAAQQFPQASPVPSEHGGTPQPYLQQQSNFQQQQNFNPQFTPTQSPARPSPTPNAMSGQMLPQQMGQLPQMQQLTGQMPGQLPSQMAGQIQNQMPGQIPNQMFPQMPQPRNTAMDQRMMYQMQMQQQHQAQQRSNMQMQHPGPQNMMHQQPGPNQGQMQAAHTAQAQAQRNMMAARQAMQNGQMPPGAMRPQQGMPQQGIPQQGMPQPGMPQPGMPQPQGMGRMQGPDSFMKNLAAFMSQKNMPLDPNPNVDGRPVHLMNLFQIVFHKFGGYRSITQSNGWPGAAQLLGFPPQHQSAPLQLRSLYERNLVKFEEYWSQQQKVRMQHQGMPNTPKMQHGTPTKAMPSAQIQQSHMMQPGQQQPQLQQGPIPSPIKPPGSQQTSVNGFPGPQPHHGPQPINAAHGQRNSMSRSIQPTPTAEEFPLPSPAQSKAGSMSLPGSAHPEPHAMHEEPMAQFPAPFATDPEEYMPCSREFTTYGGVDLMAVGKLADDLVRYKPDIPSALELGNVDIHALTRSIQSGIHGEVRLALDTLATISSGELYNGIPIPQIDLRYCDDLVETLVECAEEQADLLAENSEEASNEITISLYEDVIRACRTERLALRSVPLFGSPAYELDRAVDRLICITTILRNLSCREENHAPLAEDSVIKFLCVVIRYLGTREMLLRTQANTLDLMKDLVTLLSNIAGSVEIPGREQAFCLLQFLLAFAPSPTPTLSNAQIFFTSYDPALHPYLPHAVDSLAKLLARDEPNRTFYKAIFAADFAANSSPPGELLTRAFALAISPIPDHSRDARQSHLPSLVEARKPFLMQGLLAADIMAALAPSYETGVTRAWLASGNGFAQNLFLLVRQLSAQFEGQPMRPGGGQMRNHSKRDSELVYIVGLAVSMLKRLSEKARDPNNPTGENSIPPNVLPGRDSLLGALQMMAQEWSKAGMLQDLVAYAALED